jgi:hypothetical protein
MIAAGSPEAEALRTAAQAEGTELQEETVYEGEIGIEVLSPFELYLLGGKTPTEAHSAIKVKGYTLDYIEERWGEEVAAQLKPDAKGDVDISNSRREKDDKEDLVIVKQLYVKPSNTIEKGLYKVWAQGKVIYQSDFPYEHGELPFARFGGIRIPGAQYDSSLLFQLIPLQKELNKTISQIIEYKNLTLRPQIVSPVNALRTRPTSKPGQVIEYEWRPGMPAPDWRELNNIPQYVFTHIDQILQRINDVSGQHEASQGRTPTGARSGDMLALLMERDDSRMSLMIKDMERAMSRAYRLMLRLAQQFYSEARTLEVRGSAGILETKTFEASDLSGAKDIRLSPGTMIPKSKAFQVDELRMLLDAGHITPQQYLQMSEFGGSAELAAQWEADRRKQQREIDAVKREEQVPPPNEFDDHGAHLDVLDLYLKSIEFESLPPEQQQALLEHRSAHADAVAQAQDAAMADNIRASIAGQLRGDMTPSVIAAILSKAGVQIDLEELNREMVDKDVRDAEIRQQNMAVESELKMQEKREDASLKEADKNSDAIREAGNTDQLMAAQMRLAEAAGERPPVPEGLEGPEAGALAQGDPMPGEEELPEEMTPEDMAAAEQMMAEQAAMGQAPEGMPMPEEMTPEDMAAAEQMMAEQAAMGQAPEGMPMPEEMTPEDMAAAEQMMAEQAAMGQAPEGMPMPEGDAELPPELANLSPEELAQMEEEFANLTPEQMAQLEQMAMLEELARRRAAGEG